MINKKRLLSSILCLTMLFCSISTISACNDNTDEKDVPSASNFTISFVVDGGTYATITTTGNERISLPSDPQKEGYTFDGWYCDNGLWNQPFMVDYLVNNPISSDKSVYAKFTSKEERNISLYFVVDGVTYATVETTGNERITLPDNPQKDGYTFDGWYFDEDVWNKAFTYQTLLSSPITSNTAVYAKFNQNPVVDTYTIYFIVDGATYTTLETTGNEVITLPTIPEKSGYTFDGWFFDNGAWGQQLSANSFISSPITKNMSVYAKFTQSTNPDPIKKYTITFVVDGTSYHTIETSGNETIILPHNPTKDGHTFIGWFLDKDVWTDSFGEDSLLNLQLTENLQVYAYFILNEAIDGTLGFQYAYNEESDSYTVKGIGSCIDDEIVIPTTYNNKPVIGIDASAFEGCFRITKITIQYSVKSISDKAFYNCINLNSLILPSGIERFGTDIVSNTALFNNSTNWEDGVLYIGNYLISTKPTLANDYKIKEGTVVVLDYAFSNCSSLKNVYLPSSVTYLGICAFKNCTNLEEVTLSSNITAINESTFSGCEQLKSINIPNGVLSIKYNAFSNCLALTNISIPDSVQEINKNAFNNCPNINYEIVDGNLKYIGNWLFGVVDNTLTSANLKETTIHIFFDAFKNCEKLISVVIPDSVKSIDDYAFYTCTNLSSVTLSNNLIYMGKYAFSYCKSLTSIALPKSLISIGSDAFFRSSNLTVVSYDGNISDWCNILFSDNYSNPLVNNADLYINDTKVVELDISSGITMINSSTFSGCTSITSIILPNSVTSIRSDAFRNCYNLTEVIMPNNLSEIGEYAFYGCKALMSITIPQSVETIGNCAFYDCEKLIAVRNYSNLNIIAGDTEYGYVGYYADTIFTTADIDKELFFTSGDFLFYKNGNDEYFLVGYSGASPNVVLPDTVKGEPYSIFSNAFSGITHVTSITVPQSIKSIQKGAFFGCENLESITLPFVGETAKALDETYQYPLGYIFGTSSFNNSVSARQSYRGDDVTKPTSYTYYLPASLKTVVITGDTINYGAFSSCANIETINIENAINVDDYIFSGCSKLTSFSLPNNLKKITASMFRSCTSLKTITIPNSVTEIGNYAFDGCSILKSINIPNNVVSIGDYALYNCGALESVTILGNLDKIGNYAFCNCEKLSSISLPSTITQIGEKAFYNTPYFNTVDNWVDNALYIGNNLICLKNDLAVGEYSIKPGTTVIASDAFYNCYKITKITVPTSVITIGDYAFYGCSQMTSINLNNNINSIGSYAFYGCKALTEIEIPNNITAIKERTFYNCTGLTSVTIPSNVKTIGNYAFYNCSMLTTINYNAVNCEDLDLGSFSYPAFTKAGQDGDGITVNIGASVKHIPARLFYNIGSSPKIVALNFEETSCCETIGRYAFGYCTLIESITFPASLESVADYAFYNCTGLTAVKYLGKEVNVDRKAFLGCNFVNSETNEQYENGIYSGNTLIGVVDKTLSTLVIRDGTTAIISNALSDCTNLTSVTIPSTVTSIGYRSFYNCKGLTSITLPKSISEIESDAFENCTALTSVYYEGTLSEWCNINFSILKSNPLYYGNKLYINNTEVTSLVIPDDVTTISSYAFVNCTSITSIVIPSTVTNIGKGVFSGCSSLQSITLPFIGESLKESTDTNQYPLGYIFGTTNYTGSYAASQTYIGSKAMYLTYTTYYIPSSLTTVVLTGGQIVCGSFDNCESLTSISLPDTATEIHTQAFSGCTGLTDILIPENINYIAEDAFHGCTGLTDILIPENINYIAEDAFDGCKNLKNVHITSLEKWCGIEFYTHIYQTDTFSSNPLSIAGNLYVNGVLLTELVIPSTVDSISAGAFFGCTSLTSVTIPSTISEIGRLAFTNCTNLQTITINDGIIELPVSVFQNCSGLKTINLPASISKINDYAFLKCSSLSKVNYLGTIFDWCNIEFTSDTSNPLTNSKKLYLNDTLVSELVIPEGVTTIKSYGFKCCTGLTSVTIPTSVKTIEPYAFTDCNNIKSVSFGSGIKSIGEFAFNGCSSLNKVYYIGSIDSWINIKIETNASPLQYNAALYINDEMVENVLVIPEGTTEIPAYSFAGNKYITKVIIPSSVTVIGEGAFKNCINLSEIELGDQTKYIYADAFYNTAYYNNIANWIDGNVLYIGKALIKVKTSATGIVTIREGTYWIATGALKDCSQITELYIPESVRYYPSTNLLGSYSSLTKLSLPYLQTTLGDLFTTTYYKNSTSVDHHYQTYSFSTSSLYYIPSSLRSVSIYGGYIEYAAFAKCMMLTDVTLGDNVYGIGSNAFEQCTGLTNIVIPDNLYNINYCAFLDCRNLTNVTLGKNIKTIGEYAFAFSDVTPSYSFAYGYEYYNRPTLTIHFRGTIEDYCNINFGSTIADAKTVYINGSPITNLVIPNSVVSISDYAFANITSLRSVTISGSVTKIGKWSFSNCTNLNTITIEDGVKSIDDYAFFGDSNLTDVAIPSSVTFIGKCVFGGCSGITSITIPFVGDSKTSKTTFGYLFGKDEFKGATATKQEGLSETTTYYIPNLLTKVVVLGGNIPYGAFSNCKNLQEVIIGENVNTLDSAFDGCVNIKKIDCNGGIEQWLRFTFEFAKSTPFRYECDLYVNGTLVTEVIIPETITSINNYAFYNAHSITKITVPNTIQSIGHYAFNNCSALKYNEFNNFYYLGNESNPYLVLCGAIDKENITTFTPMAETKFIMENAFEECNALTTISLPNTILSIGAGAFSDCPVLKTVYFNVISCPYAYHIFGSSGKDVGGFDFTVGKDVIEMPEDFFAGNNGPNDNAFVKNIILEENSSLETFGDSSFYYVTTIESVYINDINDWLKIEFPESYFSSPFYSATKLFIKDELATSIVIPNGVESLNSYAFYGIKSLASVTLPSTLKSIGKGAFSNCSSLFEIYNLSNLDIFKGSSSYGDVGLNAKVIHRNIEDKTQVFGIDDFIFFEDADNCYLVSYIGNDTTVVLPESANGKKYYLSDGLFKNNTSITKVILSDDVIGVGESAFYGCKNLEMIDLRKATSIESYCFYKCEKLEEITIPYGNTTIPYCCFYGCSALTKVVLPEGLLTIGGEAFGGCFNLEEMELPSTLTYVGASGSSSNALSSCRKLMEWEGGVAYIDNWAVAAGSTKNPVIREGTVGLAACIFSEKPIESLVLPKSLKYINIYMVLQIGHYDGYTGEEITDSYHKLYVITYNGTMEEWEAIIKDEHWFRALKHETRTVVCTDGNVTFVA